MIKIEIQKPFRGYKEGDKVSVEVDSDGIPVNAFWRRRLKDSEFDGCLKILKTEKKPQNRKSDAEDLTNADDN